MVADKVFNDLLDYDYEMSHITQVEMFHSNYFHIFLNKNSTKNGILFFHIPFGIFLLFLVQNPNEFQIFLFLLISKLNLTF